MWIPSSLRHLVCQPLVPTSNLIMFCDKSETMKTSHLALVVLTVGLLCVGNAVGQDEKKAESKER